MYKSFTAEEFKKFLSIHPAYKIKGFMSYGAWDEDKHFNQIQKILDELGIQFTSQKLEGFLAHILELVISNEVYWFTVMYGGAQLSEYTHLASLFGSKKNIHIGSCGGLYPEMNSLDLLVPSWSYGNESTTRAYEPDVTDYKHYPDDFLSKSIRSKIKEDYKVWNGPVMTNQAMLGETLDDVQAWSRNNFYGVEMETATVFSVSKHFRVPSTALLYISDNLIKGQTVIDEGHSQQKNVREDVRNEVYRAGIRTLIEN